MALKFWINLAHKCTCVPSMCIWNMKSIWPVFLNGSHLPFLFPSPTCMVDHRPLHISHRGALITGINAQQEKITMAKSLKDTDIFQFASCELLIQTSLSFTWTGIYVAFMLHWSYMLSRDLLSFYLLDLKWTWVRMDIFFQRGCQSDYHLEFQLPNWRILMKNLTRNAQPHIKNWW